MKQKIEHKFQVFLVNVLVLKDGLTLELNNAKNVIIPGLQIIYYLILNKVHEQIIIVVT